MAKEYVAYYGEEFQIEWYFSEKGWSQAHEYYLQLAPVERRKLTILFEVIGKTGKLLDKAKFRSEGDKIYAFKPQPHRFFCFFEAGRRIIITNAFWKKDDKPPHSEKERALKCKESYRNRIKSGTYYEED